MSEPANQNASLSSIRPISLDSARARVSVITTTRATFVPAAY
jgi:hypothetical protein